MLFDEYNLEFKKNSEWEIYEKTAGHMKKKTGKIKKYKHTNKDPNSTKGVSTGLAPNQPNISIRLANQTEQIGLNHRRKKKKTKT